MSLQRGESGDSGLEVSDPLSLTSNTPSAHGPIKAAKPALERHISHIPAESDDDEEEEAEEVEDSNNPIKSQLKKLKNRVAKSPSHEKSPPQEFTEKRHDSRNGTSDLEVSPATNIADHETKTPSLERQVSSIGEDGLLSTEARLQQQQQQQQRRPKERSPKLERHISGIPQDDYDSDREI